MREGKKFSLEKCRETAKRRERAGGFGIVVVRRTHSETKASERWNGRSEEHSLKVQH